MSKHCDRPSLREHSIDSSIPEKRCLVLARHLRSRQNVEGTLARVSVLGRVLGLLHCLPPPCTQNQLDGAQGRGSPATEMRKGQPGSQNPFIMGFALNLLSQHWGYIRDEWGTGGEGPLGNPWPKAYDQLLAVSPLAPVKPPSASCALGRAGACRCPPRSPAP